jgi:eukaryotic-like serine/threonine-protein kinase
MSRDFPHILGTKVETPDSDLLADAANVFTDTEDYTLIQRRLGITYGIYALIVAGFYLLSGVFIAFMMPSRFFELAGSTSKLTHLFGAALLGATYLFCRGKPRPRWMLVAVDLVGSIETTLLMGVMVATAPQGLRAEMIGSLAFTLGVCLRAALVPSPPRWTLIVSVLSAIPVPIASYLCAWNDPLWPVELVPRSSMIMMSFGWCVAGTATAYAISRVVYGLRTEMKTAMRLGQYTLEDKIGEGGMGAVYRARHALLRRPTAIKILSLEKAGLANARRFEREVQLTSKLTHPNTIAIYDFGHTRSGVFYYAMELIDGLSLQELVEEHGAQPAGRVVHILAQVASALAEAHGVGLIHRDVKPANILLSARGGLPDFAKVCDFGLVKELDSHDAALSTANAIAGTPLYMAPESITAPATIDARVDLYALGCVAYWLLTGRSPFDGSNLVEICSHHLHTEPKPPSSRTDLPVPEALDALVMKCLAKAPEARPTSARVLAAELRALHAECPWSEDEARLWWALRTERKSRENKVAVELSPTLPAGEKPSAHRAAV